MQEQLDLVVTVDLGGAAALDNAENEPISDDRSATVAERVSHAGEGLVGKHSPMQPPVRAPAGSVSRCEKKRRKREGRLERKVLVQRELEAQGADAG